MHDPARMNRKQHVIVMGVIGNDIHVVGNRVLQICLEAGGFSTVNIGTNAMPEDFVDASLEVDADAVLVGSLNGEAPHWCGGLRPGLVAVGKADTWIYLGGNVVTGQWDDDRVRAHFEAMGIDRVFYGATDFDALVMQLAMDIKNGRPL